MRTRDPSRVLIASAFGRCGIHGTDEPGLIPGRPSHGCIRVPNAAITRLWQIMPIGTAVLIV